MIVPICVVNDWPGNAVTLLAVAVVGALILVGPHVWKFYIAPKDALDAAIADITQAGQQFRDRLIELCLHAIEHDEAEVIIFGGGPIAGLARAVRDDIPVPTLDGVSCAVRMAEALVGLRPRAPSRGSFARPAAKPAQGLAPELLRRITGEA